MTEKRLTLKQAEKLGIPFGKRVWQLLGITEWKINAEFVDVECLRQTPEGLDGIGRCSATPAYLEADLTWAARVTGDSLRQAIIHEHLHVVLAELRKLAERAMGGPRGNEWQMYADAEERAVTRLERAIDRLLEHLDGRCECCEEHGANR